MKRYIKKIILALVLILGLLLIALSYSAIVNKTTTNDASNVDEETTKLNEIRDREEIKRQQELIVQEVYLSEEKDRITAEKEATIKEYDLKIEEIEKMEENVRSELLLF